MSKSDKTIERGVLGNPQEVYLAVFRDESQLQAFKQALAAQGTEDITVFSSSITQDAFSSTTEDAQGESGFQNFLRTLITRDEVTKEEQYRMAVERGDSVVQIKVAAGDKAARFDVEQALQNHQAEQITYFGVWTFENIAAPSDEDT